MRSLLVLCLLVMIPAAGASAAPAVVYHDHDLQTGPTYGASVDAGTHPAPGCADCDAWGLHLGAETDGASYVDVEAKLCRSAFFYICIVDEDITLTR